MKATGITRKVDELGRIVLPSEIRAVMKIEPRDTLEIFTEEGRIVLQKYQKTCVFCDHDENLISFKGKLICSECLEKIKGQL